MLFTQADVVVSSLCSIARERVKYLEMLDHDYDISLMLCLRIKILQNVLYAHVSEI